MSSLPARKGEIHSPLPNPPHEVGRASIRAPLPDPPHKVGRAKKQRRLKKRTVQKADGRYLIYYEKR